MQTRDSGGPKKGGIVVPIGILADCKYALTCAPGYDPGGRAPLDRERTEDGAMARDNHPKHQQMRTRIAAAAARMMAEDGIEDHATAKRKAARLLGATDTRSMPGNDEVDAELRTYLSLYQADEHRERLHELRSIAIEVMSELAEFRPYLAGSVLKGTAGKYADIDLQLFTDDPKSIELLLLNRGIEYEVETQRHYCGDEPRSVSVLRLDWDGTPITLSVYAANDERMALKTTLAGRPIERAGLNAVSALLESGG